PLHVTVFPREDCNPELLSKRYLVPTLESAGALDEMPYLWTRGIHEKYTGIPEAIAFAEEAIEEFRRVLVETVTGEPIRNCHDQNRTVDPYDRTDVVYCLRNVKNVFNGPEIYKSIKCSRQILGEWQIEIVDYRGPFIPSRVNRCNLLRPHFSKQRL